jgi:perosamine synthetase
MQVKWSKLHIDENELNNLIEVVKSGWMSSGPKVKEFEDRIAGYVGVKHAIAVNSGTAALDVALKCLKIQPADEVIVPAMTYIATAHAVCYQGAIPIFADIDPRTFTIDPEKIEEKITKKTKCIIPVDYAGQGPDYDRIRKIAQKHHLYVVEDGAPGLFGKYKGKPLCSMGDISITSFHVAKIVSTIEGGMIFTNNDEYNRMARIIRWQGEDPNKKYYHPMLGFNFRMTDLHAAIGLAQTEPKRVAELLKRRHLAVDYYNQQLKKDPRITLPYVSPYNEHSWFLYPILLQHRDSINSYLLEQDIAVNVSWPLPVYHQEFYRQFAKEPCPVAERMTNQVMCLPLYYGITRQEQDYVVKHLFDAIEKFSKQP